MNEINGVTIVTAAYRLKFLKKLWRPVLYEQSYPNIEWIIVNDGQSDIRKWAGRMIGEWAMQDKSGRDVWMVDLDKRRGRYGLYGRNIGAMVAKYNRILFLDEDNMWPFDFIEKMVKAETETNKISYCDMEIIGHNDGSYREDKTVSFGKGKIDLGCLLYRKEFFTKYGYFKDDKEAHTTFDWKLIEEIHEGEGGDSAFVKVDTKLIFRHKLK